MNKKKFFQMIFLFLAIILLLLPFILTFNDILTRIVEKFILYNLLQEKIVPIEVLLVGLIVKQFGVDFIPYVDGLRVNGLFMRMSWNCLGWQSLLLFSVSFVIALWGTRYSSISKLQAVILGIVGIFWINILRISLTVILAVFSLPLYKLVFHDYLAAFVTVIYLVVFWWFAYSYVLEEKQPSIEREAIKV